MPLETLGKHAQEGRLDAEGSPHASPNTQNKLQLLKENLHLPIVRPDQHSHSADQIHVEPPILESHPLFANRPLAVHNRSLISAAEVLVVFSAVVSVWCFHPVMNLRPRPNHTVLSLVG